MGKDAEQKLRLGMLTKRLQNSVQNLQFVDIAKQYFANRTNLPASFMYAPIHTSSDSSKTPLTPAGSSSSSVSEEPDFTWNECDILRPGEHGIGTRLIGYMPIEPTGLTNPMHMSHLMEIYLTKKVKEISIISTSPNQEAELPSFLSELEQKCGLAAFLERESESVSVSASSCFIGNIQRYNSFMKINHVRLICDFEKLDINTIKTLMNVFKFIKISIPQNPESQPKYEQNKFVFNDPLIALIISILLRHEKVGLFKRPSMCSREIERQYKSFFIPSEIQKVVKIALFVHLYNLLDTELSRLAEIFEDLAKDAEDQLSDHKTKVAQPLLKPFLPVFESPDHNTSLLRDISQNLNVLREKFQKLELDLGDSLTRLQALAKRVEIQIENWAKYHVLGYTSSESGIAFLAFCELLDLAMTTIYGQTTEHAQEVKDGVHSERQQDLDRVVFTTAVRGQTVYDEFVMLVPTSISTNPLMNAGASSSGARQSASGSTRSIARSTSSLSHQSSLNPSAVLSHSNAHSLSSSVPLSQQSSQSVRTSSAAQHMPQATSQLPSNATNSAAFFSSSSSPDSSPTHTEETSSPRKDVNTGNSDGNDTETYYRQGGARSGSGSDSSQSSSESAKPPRSRSSKSKQPKPALEGGSPLQSPRSNSESSSSGGTVSARVTRAKSAAAKSAAAKTLAAQATDGEAAPPLPTASLASQLQTAQTLTEGSPLRSARSGSDSSSSRESGSARVTSARNVTTETFAAYATDGEAAPPPPPPPPPPSLPTASLTKRSSASRPAAPLPTGKPFTDSSTLGDAVSAAMAQRRQFIGSETEETEETENTNNFSS